MKRLIAVKSCRGDKENGLHKAIRDTWGKDAESFGELKFFMGDGGPLLSWSDEVVLTGVSDDYHALPHKTRAITQWALAEGYDRIFLCDTDTFLVPHLLLATGYENYDYFGATRKALGVTFRYTAPDRNKRQWFLPKCYPWASGGIGYFMSRKFMEIVSQREPDIWAEDLWLGQIAGPLYVEGKITMAHADLLEGTASWHYPRGRNHMVLGHSVPKHQDIAIWLREMYGSHQ